ncbi:hypothetical protein STEG23_025176, partial [Scotinomys teguina]
VACDPVLSRQQEPYDWEVSSMQKLTPYTVSSVLQGVVTYQLRTTALSRSMTFATFRYQYVSNPYLIPGNCEVYIAQPKGFCICDQDGSRSTSVLMTTKLWTYCFHNHEMANEVLLHDASVQAQLPFAAINSVLLLPVNISCSSEIVNPNVPVGGE